MEKKNNFVTIAEEEVQRFKDSLNDSPHDKYLDIPLFVAIQEDLNITISKDTEILKDAFECILILAYSSLAYKNYYDWYKFIYIDKDGNVKDGFNKDGWSITYTYSGDYKTKLIFLNFRDHYMYSINKESYITWEGPFKEIWSAYRYANKSETVNEAKVMCNNYRLEKYNKELQRKNDDLKSINESLEKERDQYKEILEEISTIILRYKDNNLEERT
jgi:hypothetical protein